MSHVWPMEAQDCLIVRNKYKEVDKVTGSMKKTFLKALVHITTFRGQYTNLALPPKPVLTRCGTRLTTISYYTEYLNETATFVEALDIDDSSVIKEV